MGDTTVESSVVTTVAKEEKEARVVSDTKHVKSTVKVTPDGTTVCGTMMDTNSDTVATRTHGVTTEEACTTKTTTDTTPDTVTIPDTATVEREENTTHPCTNPSVMHPLIATEDTTAVHKKTVTKSANTLVVARVERDPREEREDTTVPSMIIITLMITITMVMISSDTMITLEMITSADITVEREAKVEKEERVVSDTKYVKQSANLSTTHNLITDKLPIAMKMRTVFLCRSSFV